MTTTAELAEFAGDVSYDSLSPDVREELKKRVLDSLGARLIPVVVSVRVGVLPRTERSAAAATAVVSGIPHEC